MARVNYNNKSTSTKKKTTASKSATPKKSALTTIKSKNPKKSELTSIRNKNSIDDRYKPSATNNNPKAYGGTKLVPIQDINSKASRASARTAKKAKKKLGW
jgi:hypothetical protein